MTRAKAQTSLWTILVAFTQLGLTSFGGPVAHIGYFRDAFVVRRRWLDDQSYADLVALCQFLPGPASSQVGFAIGCMRGGLAGGIAAWIGFTMPSVLLLLAFAYGAAFWQGPVAIGILHGLKVVAVAVVAQAVWGMAQGFCKDRGHIVLMLLALLLTVFPGGTAGQLLAIAIGIIGGLALARNAVNLPPAGDHVQMADRGARIRGIAALILALVLFILVSIPWVTEAGGQGVGLFGAFYRAGALVFGGGHVILPLLETSVVGPGWVGADSFLAGYGAAQAVPGPLFTFAAYLGAISSIPPNGIAGAMIALGGIFLPGLLLIYGTLPFWASLRQWHPARAALGGVNAAVVGILLSALYHPVWTSAVLGQGDFALVVIAVVLLMVFKLPSWLVVLATAIGGLLLSLVA